MSTRQFVFEQEHRALWAAFEAQLQQLESSKKPLDAEAALGFGRDYGRVCHHLALANDRHYSGGLSAYLQNLAERGHKQLYRHQGRSLWQQFKHFVVRDFPQSVRAQKALVLWAHALFYLPLFAALLLVALHPPLLAKWAGADVGAQAAESYREMAAQYAEGVNREAWKNGAMFGFYVFNNIGIAFQSFAGGLLLGIGAIYVMVYNGLMIGGIMGYMLHEPAGTAFYSFIVAHGAFELTGLVLAGAGGLRLGLALLMPQGLSRRDALRVQGGEAIKLMSGAFLLLALAALVEAFWSPLTSIPLAVKFVVGPVLWLLVYTYLWRAGR